MGSIGENLKRVREQIETSLIKAGRKDSVTLIAVTKTIPPDRISEAIREGVKVIGENRVQEAQQKHRLIRESVSWHMVGHLQRNKVKHALPIFEMIQSIDRMETAQEIEKRATQPIDVLIEINSSGEETKSGIEPNELFSLVDTLRNLKKLNIRGVMTIGPFTDDEKSIRKAFALTREKFIELKEREKDLDINYLSMGMSSDYPLALLEGSNMVRIGTAIFGPRM